ncbi:Uncharacterized protein Rs2_27010 [Raphanus sativus]|nr:Uncharacterized protein Rs2_27010 [Raphanus sativus]
MEQQTISITKAGIQATLEAVVKLSRVLLAVKLLKTSVIKDEVENPGNGDDDQQNGAAESAPATAGSEEQVKLEIKKLRAIIEVNPIQNDNCSFAILGDKLGLNRTEFPHTLYIVAGTQAEKASLNSIGTV